MTARRRVLEIAPATQVLPINMLDLLCHDYLEGIDEDGFHIMYASDIPRSHSFRLKKTRQTPGLTPTNLPSQPTEPSHVVDKENLQRRFRTARFE